MAIVHRPKPESQFYLQGFDKRTQVELGTVYDDEFIESIFRRHDIKVFFHAAYGADVNRVLNEPLECFRSTAESTWKILDFVRHEKPGCISVISSSDKAYGSQELPYRESNPLAPGHPYEVVKASQDMAAQSYGKYYGLPVAVTRCANYFGGFDFNFTGSSPVWRRASSTVKGRCCGAMAGSRAISFISRTPWTSSSAGRTTRDRPLALR